MKAGYLILSRMNYKELILSGFEYYTPKVVHLKNKKIGVLNRFIQFAIIVYIVGFVLYWEKGYQKFSTIESSSVSKLKGVVYPNFTDDEFMPDVRHNIPLYRRTWDVIDYVVLPSENNAFFVMTNVLITPDQVLSTCPEDYHKPGAQCASDLDCPEGHSVPTGNGVFTGSCVTSDWNATYRVCEIRAWCPVERDFDPLLNNKALLAATQNSTVLIKSYAAFTLFNIRRRNIPDNLHDFRCINRVTPSCPIFVLKDIVPGNYDEIAVKGGSVAIEIVWNCDFDYDVSYCLPVYRFRRLDMKEEAAPGQNFRFAKYYSDTKRTLYKAYGIRFVIFTLGHGGKFNVVPLMLNIGSGLGLLAVTTIICDIIVLYCVRKREFYYHHKYQDVSDQDASQSRSNTISAQDESEPFITEQQETEPLITEQRVIEPFITEQQVIEPLITEQRVIEPLITEQRVKEPLVTEQPAKGTSLAAGQPAIEL